MKYYRDRLDFSSLKPNNIDRIQLEMVPAGSWILEIGCASGNLSEYLILEKNCEVIAVEADSDQALFARERGLSVMSGCADHPKIQAQIDDYVTTHKPFDVVFMSQVIEHLADPKAMLLKIRDWLAAGVRLVTIESAAGDGVAVVRAMPNTPALVRLGASAIAAGSTATDADVEWAESILFAVGIVERMSESALDAFTGVAGSGPAYVFLVAEALIDAAVAQGLSRLTAERIVSQLLLGASTLLDQQGDPRRLRAMVTSPGGTTAAGIAVLEDHSIVDAFGDAVRAATERSRELG